MKTSDAIQSLGQLIARILIGSLFLAAGIVKTRSLDFYFPYTTSAGLRAPEITLPFAFVIEIAASLMLIVGWKTRWAAWILLFYTVILTVVFHAYSGPDEAQYLNQISHVLKNLGVAGGLIYIAFYGAGSFSLDGRSKRPRGR